MRSVLTLPNHGNRDDVDIVVVVRAERRDVLAAVKLLDQGREHIAQRDHEHDLALVLP